MGNMSGQWIGKYVGTNTGTFVIELDKVDDHYEGTAVAWDSNPLFFCALARLQTKNVDDQQCFSNLPLIAIHNNGDYATQDELKNAEASGVSHPSSITLELKLQDNGLLLNWSTSIGTIGSGSALIQKTKGGQCSSLKNVKRCSWAEFKVEVSALKNRTFIYRGQKSSEWRLRTSFHRTGRACLERYILNDAPELARALSSLHPHQFQLESFSQLAAFLNLAQHHGYPTPLLDWTWSPYVAAFFAFHQWDKRSDASSDKHVRIYKFNVTAWKQILQFSRMFPSLPNISVVDSIPYGNPRAIPQQAISTSTNIDDIENHIELMERMKQSVYLDAFDVPVAERSAAMQELSLMGITAGSLFPGLDGACESLREQNF
jgi:hypothetical protein